MSSRLKIGTEKWILSFRDGVSPGAWDESLHFGLSCLIRRLWQSLSFVMDEFLQSWKSWSQIPLTPLFLTEPSSASWWEVNTRLHRDVDHTDAIGSLSLSHTHIYRHMYVRQSPTHSCLFLIRGVKLAKAGGFSDVYVINFTQHQSSCEKISPLRLTELENPLFSATFFTQTPKSWLEDTDGVVITMWKPAPAAGLGTKSTHWSPLAKRQHTYAIHDPIDWLMGIN